MFKVKCKNCNNEIDNNSTFCTYCGNKTTLEQNAKTKNKRWLVQLSLLSLTWIVFYLTVVRHGVILSDTIAESIGGVIFILGLPLIITALIYIVKTIRNKPYTNFTSVMVQGALAILVLSIGSEFISADDKPKENDKPIQELVCKTYDIKDAKTDQSLNYDKKTIDDKRVLLAIYNDRVNDGTFDYYHTNSESDGAITTTYYRNPKNNDHIILLSKQLYNGIESYPMRFVMGNTLMDMACIDKSALRNNKK